MRKNYQEHVSVIEREIISALISAIFREGLSISVSDGVKRSIDRQRIEGDIAACDTTELVLYKDREKVGWVLLVHGNKGDVISDYTYNEVCSRIWDRVEPSVDYWAG